MTAAKTSLQEALDELADGGRPLSPRTLREFSDLDSAALKIVQDAWPPIPTDRKRLLLDGLRDLSDENTLVSFEDFARLLLTDPAAEVRTRALRLLDESHDTKLIPAFIKILAGDTDADARAQAATTLGQFVELGELEEIPATLQRKVEDALLERANSEDRLEVRRNALESLGFSSRPEVATLIESAFHRENPDWQASALFAMGRSSDERWEEQVISRLDDVSPVVRLAAVEAAGELRLASARSLIFQVLEDEDEDEITTAAIWTLSQLGGEDARLYIQNLLDQAEEEEHVQFLEDALDNLQFTDELSGFDMLTIEPDQDE